MLQVIRDHILPLTREEVARGNHVFGGAILRKGTWDLVVAGTNRRTANPLFHGEIDTLNRFFALHERPPLDSLVFLATHAPCPMCAAAIAWAGFDELWYLFAYDDVAADFDMPVDLFMYKELFGSEGVMPENPFFRKLELKDAIMASPEKDTLLPLLTEVETAYAQLEVQDFIYPGMTLALSRKNTA